MTTRYTLPTFGIHERVGTGALLPAGIVGTRSNLIALASLRNHANSWQSLGYAVTWHAHGDWFSATHETMPTVYAVVREDRR